MGSRAVAGSGVGRGEEGWREMVGEGTRVGGGGQVASWEWGEGGRKREEGERSRGGRKLERSLSVNDAST